MPFEVNAKQFLLTYPKCSLTKEEVLQALQALQEIKSYTVCRELHKDAESHIHACVSFTKKVHTTSCRFFDINGSHPNIECLKLVSDFQRATKYVKKDGDFISNVEESVSKRHLLAKRLLEHGQIDEEIIRENPELLFVNYSSVSSWLGHLRPKKSKIVFPTEKKRHFWLYGPSNCGKTTLLRKYVEDKEACEIPDNNDYRCNSATEVLWADEYKGHLTVQSLNRLCDGNTQLNKKGGSCRIGFPIVFICSNYSIKDCYKNISDDIYITLCNRFKEYDLSQEIPDL